MASTLEGKKKVVEEIKENSENAQSIVIVDYQGLNVKDVTDLRQQFRNNGVNYKVYKNTLVNIAFKDLGYKDYEQYLTGANAFVFSNEDLSQGAKIAKDFQKEHDKLEIKAGIIDGKILDKDQVLQVANLPSKEQLLQQVLYGMNAPITGFARALNGIIGKLAYALSDLKDKAEGQNVENVSDYKKEEVTVE